MKRSSNSSTAAYGKRVGDGDSFVRMLQSDSYRAGRLPFSASLTYLIFIIQSFCK